MFTSSSARRPGSKSRNKTPGGPRFKGPSKPPCSIIFSDWLRTRMRRPQFELKPSITLPSWDKRSSELHRRRKALLPNDRIGSRPLIEFSDTYRDLRERSGKARTRSFLPAVLLVNDKWVSTRTSQCEQMAFHLTQESHRRPGVGRRP